MFVCDDNKVQPVWCTNCVLACLLSSAFSQSVISINVESTPLGGCRASLKPEAHSSTSLAGCTFLSLALLSLQPSPWAHFHLFFFHIWLFFSGLCCCLRDSRFLKKTYSTGLCHVHIVLHFDKIQLRVYNVELFPHAHRHKNPILCVTFPFLPPQSILMTLMYLPFFFISTSVVFQ